MMKLPNFFASLLLAILLFGSFNFFTVKLAKANPSSNWLNGWTYRKSHIINGSTAGNQTDYQICIKVHNTTGADNGEHVYLENKCKPDFGDIRFTKSDGVTELDYWLEEYSGGVAAFWVKLDSIPASPSTVLIFIYYGNFNAKTKSNGNDTFLFFDDFNNLNNWTIHSGTWSIEDGTAKCTAQGILKRSFSNNDGAILYRAKISNTADYWRAIVCYRINSDISSGYRSGWGYHSELGEKMIFIDENYYGWKAIAYTTKEWSVNTWYVAETRFYGSSHKFEFNHDDSSISVTDSTKLHEEYIGIEASSASNTSPIWFDWYAFRKYVDPEPGHVSWGDVESFTFVPDKVNILLYTERSRVEVGRNVSITYYAVYGLNEGVFNGSVILNDTIFSQDRVGRRGYKVIGIIDNEQGWSEFTANEVYAIWDRIKTETVFKTLNSGTVQVIMNLKFEYDGSPVDDALVRINNVAVENMGNGMYRAILYTWMPFSIINIKVERAGFEPITTEAMIYSLGNIIVESSAVLFTLFTFHGLNAIRVQRKRWRMSLNKLEELVKDKRRIEIREASEATGMDIDNIKALFVDMVKKNSSLQGFFINDNKEFMLESALISSINSMGKFDFEELSVNLNMPIGEAKEIFSKLRREGKIKGVFTLDGKFFITEDELEKMIMRDTR